MINNFCMLFCYEVLWGVWIKVCKLFRERLRKISSLRFWNRKYSRASNVWWPLLGVAPIWRFTLTCLHYGKAFGIYDYRPLSTVIGRWPLIRIKCYWKIHHSDSTEKNSHQKSGSSSIDRKFSSWKKWSIYEMM